MSRLVLPLATLRIDTLIAAGSLWDSCGRLAQADELYTLALDAFSSGLHSCEDLDLLDLTEVGRIAERCGRPAEAIRCYRYLLEMETDRLGSEAPELATAHRNLAAKFLENDETEAAYSHLQRALVLGQRVTGFEDPANAPLYCELGLLAIVLDRFTEAAEFLEQALECQWKSETPSIVELIVIYEYLGHVYFQMENLDEAVVLFEERVRLVEILYGKGEPETARAYLALAECRLLMGRLTDAHELFSAALAIYSKQPSSETLQCARIREFLLQREDPTGLEQTGAINSSGDNVPGCG